MYIINRGAYFLEKIIPPLPLLYKYLISLQKFGMFARSGTFFLRDFIR